MSITISRPRLFAELCCGSATTTLALLGGLGRRAPTSYQGSKLGYREAILDELGLAPGQGADAVLLADPGPWGLAWTELSTAEGCQAVAGQLRDWAAEDPRELFTALRSRAFIEGDIAGWLVLQHWNYARKPAEPGLLSFNRGAAYTAAGESTLGRLAARVEDLVEMPWPVRRIEPTSALDIHPDRVGDWLVEEGLVDPPTFGAVLDGVVVYIDPPYMNTSGYGHDLARPEVLELAQRWAAAGAVVAVSEAVPLDAELGAGWTAAEITDRRRGPPRTWSRQRREFLTVRRQPTPSRGRPATTPRRVAQAP